jgi:hypothetical protein
MHHHAAISRRRCSTLTPPRSTSSTARSCDSESVPGRQPRVGERDVRPDGIDDATLAWWVAAHGAIWRRRFERSETVAITNPVAQVELRKPGSANRRTDRPFSKARPGCLDPRPTLSHPSVKVVARCPTRPHAIERSRRTGTSFLITSAAASQQASTSAAATSAGSARRDRVRRRLHPLS